MSSLIPPEWLTPERLLIALRTLSIFLAGLVVLWITARKLRRQPWMEESHRKLLLNLVSALLFGLILIWTLNELGFKLGPLLGAAGLLTVALGFASQTAVSNLISGLFLIIEKPFHPGEIIQVGDVKGEVLAIDLLSTKVRSFDNQLIRLPNESTLKANVRNFTRWPIRRMDLQIGVSYDNDLEQVIEVLRATADSEPLCLDEPAPLILFTGFGESSQNLQLSVWTSRATYLEILNKLPIAVKRNFDQAGITIPFPQRVLHGNLTFTQAGPTGSDGAGSAHPDS